MNAGASVKNRRANLFSENLMHATLDAFFLITIVISLGIIVALWLYYDRQDGKLCDRQRFRHVYRCIKCGRLYERRGQREVAPCPDCGFSNDRLRF